MPGKLNYPIPVNNNAIRRLLEYNNSAKFLYIQDYNKGFLEGYQSSLIPHIDTPEQRKELILKLVQQDISNFPINFFLIAYDQLPPENSQYFSAEKFYQYGVNVGKVYKAWEFILETPLFYENSFYEWLNAPLSLEAKYPVYKFLTKSQQRERLARLKKLEEEIEKEKLAKQEKNLKDKSTSIAQLKCDNAKKEEHSGRIINFTNFQLDLIAYYFLKLHGVEPRVNGVDVASIAKFVHVIKGIKVGKIQNSDDYKRILSIPNFKRDENLLNDLKIIREAFNEGRLKGVVKLIDDEIKVTINELNTPKPKYRVPPTGTPTK